jgi:hypothetical protein
MSGDPLEQFVVPSACEGSPLGPAVPILNDHARMTTEIDLPDFA